MLLIGSLKKKEGYLGTKARIYLFVSSLFNQHSQLGIKFVSFQRRRACSTDENSFIFFVFYCKFSQSVLAPSQIAVTAAAKSSVQEGVRRSLMHLNGPNMFHSCSQQSLSLPSQSDPYGGACRLGGKRLVPETFVRL